MSWRNDLGKNPQLRSMDTQMFRTVFGRNRNSLDDLVDYLQKVSENLPPRVVIGFDQSEPELIKRFVKDTREFVEVNESQLGIESFLENLYEVNFRLDEEGYKLIWKVIDDWELSRAQYEYLEELRR
ncbi:MAG: hypothetical protein GC178_15255 [Flavobacteriales bacterium]|nr:hypothetical protein [Flavobacteriales bacterium]